MERGDGDRPLEPVIIARSGELELVSVEVSESETDAEEAAAAEDFGGGGTARLLRRPGTAADSGSRASADAVPGP